MKKVNIILDKKLHARAKALAAIKGVSLNDYLSEAIDRATEEEKKLFEVVR